MIEAEHNVLGGVLMDPRSLDDVVGVLGADDFINPLHRDIFRAFNDLEANGQGIDVFTVSEWLEKHTKRQSEIGYLGQIQKNTPSAHNVAHYATSVRAESLNRQLQAIAQRMYQQCNGREDVFKRIDEAQTQIMLLSERRGDRQAVGMREVLSSVVDAIDARFNAKGEISGLLTGYKQLDELLDGLHKGELIVIAGRPSMGKTTLAMNIAEHQAQDGTVLVFSMEMSADQLGERLLSSCARVNFQKIRSGKLHDDDWPKITAGVSKAVEKKVLIDDRAGLTVSDVRARARQVWRNNGLSMIVLDYLQLMEGEGTNRNDVVGEISRGLKRLAKEMEIPVIALSQLNRGLENRGNKRPIMSDLRESGSIEQDADVILFIYRDEVYDRNSPDKGKAEVIIGKQRNGPLGTAMLAFQGQYCRFENFWQDAYVECEPVEPKKWEGGGFDD